MKIPDFIVTDKLISSLASLLCDAAAEDGNCDNIDCGDCLFNKSEDVKAFLNLDTIDPPAHRVGCKCHECTETEGCDKYHREKEE